MIPENELGVLVLFAQLAEQAEFKIVFAQAAFPDLIIEKGGVAYRAELEYKASNFNLHKHDIRKCDLVICWENDIGKFVLPILALNKDGWQDADLSQPSTAEKAAAYWERRARLAESRLMQARQEISAINAQDGEFGHKKIIAGLNYTGRRVLCSLAKNPEQTHKEVAQEIGISRQAVGQHVAKLESLCLLNRSERNGVKVLVDINDVQVRLRPNEIDELVKEVLVDSPGIGPRALARELNIASSTAHYALKRVMENGGEGECIK